MIGTGRFSAATSPTGSRGRAGFVVGFAVATAVVVGVLAPRAEAIRARVSLPNGDIYTGEWLRSDGSQFLIRLDDGQELQWYPPAFLGIIPSPLWEGLEYGDEVGIVPKPDI